MGTPGHGHHIRRASGPQGQRLWRGHLTLCPSPARTGPCRLAGAARGSWPRKPWPGSEAGGCAGRSPAAVGAEGAALGHPRTLEPGVPHAQHQELSTGSQRGQGRDGHHQQACQALWLQGQGLDRGSHREKAWLRGLSGAWEDAQPASHPARGAPGTRDARPYCAGLRHSGQGVGRPGALPVSLPQEPPGARGWRPPLRPRPRDRVEAPGGRVVGRARGWV